MLRTVRIALGTFEDNGDPVGVLAVTGSPPAVGCVYLAITPERRRLTLATVAASAGRGCSPSAGPDVTRISEHLGNRLHSRELRAPRNAPTCCWIWQAHAAGANRPPAHQHRLQMGAGKPAATGPTTPLSPCEAEGPTNAA